jgi:hypothetical protein
MARLYLIGIIVVLIAAAVAWYLHRKKRKSTNDPDPPFTGNVDSDGMPPQSDTPSTGGLAWETEARALAKAGRKIEAIKLVRERTGLDLKAAKEYFERL